MSDIWGDLDYNAMAAQYGLDLGDVNDMAYGDAYGGFGQADYNDLAAEYGYNLGDLNDFATGYAGEFTAEDYAAAGYGGGDYGIQDATYDRWDQMDYQSAAVSENL